MAGKRTPRSREPRAPSSTKVRPQGSTSLRDGISLAALFVITLIVHGGAVGNGLLNWDDNFYITQSPYLRDLSWTGVKAMFGAFLVGNYHPLTLLSYAVEYQLAGRIDPALMHTTNIVLHAINSVLVFLLVKRLVQDHWVAWWVALLFAVHPMHVESVAWIAERKDVLYTAFFLAALIVYIDYVRKPAITGYLLVLVLFVLALLAKSAAAALAPVLLLIDYYERRPDRLRCVLEKLPFLAVAVGFGIIALDSQAGAMDASFAPHFPVWQRPVIVANALSFYLSRFFVPWGLSALHPYPVQPGEALTPLVIPAAIAVIALGLVLWYIWRTRTHWRLTVLGLGFFLITLAMVLQFFPVGRAIVAERYSYVPYIGLALVVVSMAMQAWRAGRNTKGFMHMVPLGALAVGSVVFTFMTVERIGVWKDSYTLFADMLEHYPEDGLIHYNRGLTHYYDKQVKASIADYTACIRFKPDCAPCYFNRGLSYKDLGDMQAVIRDMDAALELKPDYAEAYRNRGNAKAMQKDYPASIADFTQALNHAPNDTDTWVNRGLSHYFSGSKEQACSDWRKATTIGSKKAAGLVSQQCSVE